jgi:hypothetical protein
LGRSNLRSPTTREARRNRVGIFANSDALQSNPAKTLVSPFDKIGRDHRLWSRIEWRTAEELAQRRKVRSTVLLLSGEVGSCVQ